MSAARFLACSVRGEPPRRWACALLASAFAVAAAGVPLPVVKSQKSSEMFPCATSGCGCNSAEKCWRSCCCRTLAERLAWAAENGVTPPAFALADAARAGLDSRGNPLAAKVIRIVLAEKPVVTKTCCQSKHACCKPKPNPDKQDEAANFIVAWRALGCHGLSLNWLAAVPTLISVELDFADQLPLIDHLGPPSAAIAVGISDVPTPPPPERS